MSDTRARWSTRRRVGTAIVLVVLLAAVAFVVAYNTNPNVWPRVNQLCFSVTHDYEVCEHISPMPAVYETVG